MMLIGTGTRWNNNQDTTTPSKASSGANKFWGPNDPDDQKWNHAPTKTSHHHHQGGKVGEATHLGGEIGQLGKAAAKAGQTECDHHQDKYLGDFNDSHAKPEAGLQSLIGGLHSLFQF